MRGAQAVRADDRAADAQAFRALNGPVDLEARVDDGRAADAQHGPAAQIAVNAQIPLAGQRVVHLHAPGRDQVAARLQGAEGADPRRCMQVAPDGQRVAHAQAAAGTQRTADAHQRSHVHPLAHFERAGEHEGIGRDRVHHANGVDGTELVHQPTGVGRATVIDQRVDDVLVLRRALEVPGEPAESAGAGSFGPKGP